MAGVKVGLMSNSGPPARGDSLLAIGELADRKLPEITALIQRTQLVLSWLESAARCECPNLAECPLFDDPVLEPAESGRRRPARP